MNIVLDDGYSFGLGLFETVHIFKNNALFLKEHLERINNSIDTLSLDTEKIFEQEVVEYLEENKSFKENEVLKIIVSEKNRIFLKRDYIYATENYEKGFKINISKTRRNENSVFTYHKSLNYADNIFEKRKSIKLGYDEALFLNPKNLICEGATSNIFFIKNKQIFTPNISSGLLDGIIRQWIIKNFEVIELEIPYDRIEKYDEVFITNSLIGIMPVASIENMTFSSKNKTLEILEKYKKAIVL